MGEGPPTRRANRLRVITAYGVGFFHLHNIESFAGEETDD